MNRFSETLLMPKVRNGLAGVVFGLSTCDYCGVVSKLEPVDWIEELMRKTKLSVFLRFYVLNKSVEAKVK